MYAKRVQIQNYGPIEHLDIALPFDGDNPKPVLLVGENGSGKSILLSHIMNGLLAAQQVAYPENPEVEAGRVYKLRSSSYIKSGSEYYFGRVDFEDDLFRGEIRSHREKQQYSGTPAELPEGDAKDAWDGMNSNENDHVTSNISNDESKIEETFKRNCILYFPPNRFEEPAWLNEDNLNARAQYMDLRQLKGYTDRSVINYSPLRDNQNWLFEVIYDRAAFEIQTRNYNLPIPDSAATIPLPLFVGYSGDATSTYNIALQIVQKIVPEGQNARLGIGRRHNRVISIQSDSGTLVPNIFQLSSGETSLLNLFLTILRDFDMTHASFASASEIRGVVIVDEIDLHLHANHQHEILPALIKMFPKIQFIVTTHSPLFILGMSKLFGESGFDLYRLPKGIPVGPEEFSEFNDAYAAFTETVRHSRLVQNEIENAQKSIVIPEGETDRNYIRQAAELLGKQDLVDGIDVWEGKGSGNLNNIWKASKLLSANLGSLKIMLLYDCDTGKAEDNRESLLKRVIPYEEDNPLTRGIENLFSKETLQLAREHKPDFFDVEEGHIRTVRGTTVVPIPEKWEINSNEKMNLCNWICDHGSQDDFQGFGVVFDLLEELLEEDS